VMVSDGRANVPLAVSNGNANEDDPKPTRDELKEEVIATARGLRGLPGFNLVVLDTENKFVSTGMAKEIAAAAGGKYHVSTHQSFLQSTKHTASSEVCTVMSLVACTAADDSSACM
jgi:Mg-chelatase subunit ChlD